MQLFFNLTYIMKTWSSLVLFGHEKYVPCCEIKKANMISHTEFQYNIIALNMCICGLNSKNVPYIILWRR